MTKLKALSIFLVLSVLISTGCWKKKEPPSTPLSVGMKTYKGHFLSYQYPSSATLNILSERESVLTGPSLTINQASESSNTANIESKYAYQIHIQIYDNPMKLTADVWAKDHIINEWKRTKDGTTIYPVTPGGQIIEENARFVQVGKEKAFMVDSFGYDQAIKSLYFSKEDKVIEINFTLFPVETEPMAIVQRDIYALILNTLSLVDKK